MPDDVVFQTQPQIALDQLRAACAPGIVAEVVLADAGYGNDTDFYDGITAIGLPYVVSDHFPHGGEALTVGTVYAAALV